MKIITIFDAVRDGDLDDVKRIYRGDINEVKNDLDLNLLCMAMTNMKNETEKIKIIKFLIDEGININYTTSESQRNALHMLYFCNLRPNIDYMVEVTKLLIDNGIGINGLDEYNAIPLKYSITINKLTTDENKPLYGLANESVPIEQIEKIVILDDLKVSGGCSYLFAFFPNVQKIENINRLNVSNAERLDSLFSGDFNLQELDLSTWDMKNMSISDSSGMFSGCSELKKLKLGYNFKISTVQGITEPPQDNPMYTGKWRAVGAGSDRRPEGYRWESVSDFMAYYNAETQADTYVWEPVIGTVLIHFVDNSDNTIHENIEYTEKNVGEFYDVSAPDYQLQIPGYSINKNKYPENRTGQLANNKIVDVTYVYDKHEPIEQKGNVITKYVDESGFEIAESDSQNGTIGDTYSTITKKIEGYTLDENKKPKNSVGTYRAEDIMVIYVYKKNKINDTNNTSNTNETSDTNNTINEDNRTLPKTGEKNSNELSFLGFFVIVFSFSIYLFYSRENNKKIFRD